MKTKINRVLAAFTMILVLISCSDEFIDVDPKGSVLEDNYYQTEAQAYSAMVAVYDILRKHSGGFENMIAMLNAGSDDHYAGGGGATDGTGIQSFSNYTIDPSTIPASFWNDFYQGIFRANKLLEKIPAIEMNEATKARFTAETRVLRAYYYFQLVTLYRDIPLITVPLPASEIYDVTQAPRAEVYTFIENELAQSLDDLPPTITNMETEAGRLTRGAAQALLGKVFLYQNKMDQAAAQLAEVNGVPGGSNQYGYELLDNFEDLWEVDNKFHSESILEVSHTNQSNTGWGNWGSGSDEGNSLNVMVGPRGYSRPAGSTAPDYAAGWSFSVVTADLHNAMLGDPRYDATILDMNTLVANGQASYTPGYQDTGYFLKKFMPTNADVTTGGGDAVLNYRQNTYIIRLADTYLMEAEALGGTGARAQALLDAVRARVGLPSVPVSLNAIYNERRLELAGEGHRWMDLVRTGRAAAVLGSRGFVAGKHEFLPIPLNETENTQIVQDPNY
ncbi:MAG TPA: RagB/SusD family nutrient uptake outer membrane protein [Flavobacterium sp.]